LEFTVFQNAGLDASQRQKCHLIRNLFILFSHIWKPYIFGL
jgi:hypothetical protein